MNQMKTISPLRSGYTALAIMLLAAALLSAGSRSDHRPRLRRDEEFGRSRRVLAALQTAAFAGGISLFLHPSRVASAYTDTTLAARLDLLRTETHRLLERAYEIVNENGGPADPKIREALERAREMLRGAEEAIAAHAADEGMFRIARTREMMCTAVRAEVGRPTRERLTIHIKRVEALRGETGNLAVTCPVPGIKGLMERAEMHLKLARAHMEGGHLESAAAEIAIAHSLYRRISELCARY